MILSMILHVCGSYIFVDTLLKLRMPVKRFKSDLDWQNPTMDWFEEQLRLEEAESALF